MDKLIEVLSRIPSDVWTAIGVALIAFSGVWLTNWNNRKSLKIQLEHGVKLQYQRLCQRRLEEVYSLVTEWRKERHVHITLTSLLIRGKNKPEDYLQYVKTPRFNVHDSRIEMLVLMYAESARDAFKDAMSLQLEIENLETEYIDSMNSNPKVELDVLLNTLRKDFSKASQALQNEIVKAAKEA